jgi:hypothetical protein
MQRIALSRHSQTFSKRDRASEPTAQSQNQQSRSSGLTGRKDTLDVEKSRSAHIRRVGQNIPRRTQLHSRSESSQDGQYRRRTPWAMQVCWTTQLEACLWPQVLEYHHGVATDA